jgi:hypothetical protein
MKIFKELKRLGYIHYSATTIEELDDLPLNSAERVSEQALVLRWFRERHNLMFQIFYLRNGNHAVIIHRTTPEYMDLVDQVDPSSGCVDEVVDCYSHEEAELACLKKLIEICKNK